MEAQMSISWWTDQQKVVYPYSELLFGHENEQCMATYYNMDGYAKWEKALTKATYSAIPFIWNVQRGKSVESENRLVVAKARGRKGC